MSIRDLRKPSLDRVMTGLATATVGRCGARVGYGRQKYRTARFVMSIQGVQVESKETHIIFTTIVNDQKTRRFKCTFPGHYGAAPYVDWAATVYY